MGEVDFHTILRKVEVGRYLPRYVRTYGDMTDPQTDPAPPTHPFSRVESNAISTLTTTFVRAAPHVINEHHRLEVYLHTRHVPAVIISTLCRSS